jgi:DNA invertase Pin-like site-specific DNA recombinase
MERLDRGSLAAGSGYLERFLEQVEAGEIPTDSILLMENIDRLSREGPAQALRQIIFKLWDHHIVLQTLSPEENYPPGCENARNSSSASAITD